MRKLFLLLLASAVLLSAAPFAQQSINPADTRLVLLIAVDQFRYDYLTRFRSDYNAGFAKLLTNGAVFTNPYHEPCRGVTAGGHATMLSGATPSVSGIIGNDWF